MRHRRVFTIEQLESRWCMAAPFQNADLPCDVDASNRVTPADVLVLVNSLNRDGMRPLVASGDRLPSVFWDVNGDSYLSPSDPLLVINALNRAGLPPTLVASALPGDDPNFNLIVLRDQLQLSGQTTPGARIRVFRASDGTQPDHLAWQVVADGNGAFQATAPLELGANAFSIEARDELGRLISLAKTWYRGDVVADWNATMLNAIRDWTGVSNDPYRGRIVPSPPPVAARHLAMMHVAMFDAINAVEGRFASYLPDLPRDEQASPIAALATAAHRVASRLYSDRDELPVWDATLQASLSLVPDGEAKVRGIQLGEQVASRLLAARTADGSSVSVSYVPSSEPGHWNRTTPDYTPPLLPQWPGVKPFAIGEVTAFRPSPPPALDSAEYAAAVDEVMRLGRLDSVERTAEQTAISLFWSDGAGTATPPGHWNRIATKVLMQDGRDLVERARVFALLNLALADAGIASWDAKYHYDLWRPIDAIRRAAEDGNEATLAVTTWSPLLKTPAFPSYTSGHSTFSSAAAAVLTRLLGDHVAFTSTTDPHSGLTQRPLAPELIVTRHFTSFWDAAEEAGVSRIYGGIHYGFDNTAGKEVGQAVGEAVVSNWLRELTPDA